MNAEKLIAGFLRVSLSVAFLSAVADRFGLWGGPGANQVAWGDFESFVKYTAVLNPWAPDMAVQALAWIATVAEVILGVFLLIGYKVKKSALLSGILLLVFGLSMTLSLGVKAPLNYSVFSASAAAFSLFLIKKNTPKKFFS